MKITKRIAVIVMSWLVAFQPALAENSSSLPPKFPIPWANSAGSPTYINPIPTASQIGIKNCAASLHDGFPPLTFQSSGAGGCAPFGADFNGILNQITLWSLWQSIGGPVFYDSVQSAAVGGYPKWAALANASTPGCLWVSTVEGNTTDPDTGGANWLNTCAQAVGGVLAGNLPNPGMAAGAAAANVGTLGGSLAGTLPNPSIANTGVVPGVYTASQLSVGADGRITGIINGPFPTYTTLKSGSGATYTPPAGAKRLKIRMIGGGGGGENPPSTSGGNGGQTSFGSTTAKGGSAGAASVGGLGGTGGATATGTEILRLNGAPGGGGWNVNVAAGGTTAVISGAPGGNGPFGGGAGQSSYSGSALAASPNSGGGGAGGPYAANSTGSFTGSSGGGSGEYVEFFINAPAASYTYTVGAAGAASETAGAGAAGVILIEEFYT